MSVVIAARNEFFGVFHGDFEGVMSLCQGKTGIDFWVEIEGLKGCHGVMASWISGSGENCCMGETSGEGEIRGKTVNIVFF